MISSRNIPNIFHFLYESGRTNIRKELNKKSKLREIVGDLSDANFPGILQLASPESNVPTNNDISVYKFISIKSAIEVNNPDKIYFHYCKLPNGNLWDKIKDKMILKKILMPKIYENKINKFIEIYKKVIIYKFLHEYGGVYLDINSICINPLYNLLKYNFARSINDEIIYAEEKSSIANKYFEFYLNIAEVIDNNNSKN